MNAHEISAAPAIDIDERNFEYGSLHEYRHLLARTKGRGAADEKTGVPVGDLRATRLDALAAPLAREFLGGNLAVAVHQDDKRAGVFVLHDQRLDYGVFADIQFTCRNGGAAVLLVVVKMARIGDPMLAQEAAREGFGGMVFGLGHDPGPVMRMDVFRRVGDARNAVA